MSAINPETIDVTQPPPTNPTTSGLRAVIAAIKSLFTSAKAEIDGLLASATTLDGRVTAIEEGGGGGGMTATSSPTFDFAAGQTHILTHPEVPLTEVPIVVGICTVPGVLHEQPNDCGWTAEDLNENAATWIQDTSTDGHFSVAPGARVVQGCWMYIGAGHYTLRVIIGDGTEPSSVNLGENAGTNPILRIAALYDSGGYVQTTSNPGFSVPGVFSYVVSDTARDRYTGEPITVDQLGEAVELIATADQFDHPRGAVSRDGGVTWHAFDGTDWAPIDLHNLETAGCRLNAGSWYGSHLVDGAVDLGKLATLLLDAGEDLDIRMAIGGIAVNESACMYNLALQIREPSFPGLLGLTSTPGQGMGGTPVTIGVKRLSTTQLQLSMHAYASTLHGVVVTVWTRS